MRREGRMDTTFVEGGYSLGRSSAGTGLSSAPNRGVIPGPAAYETTASFLSLPEFRGVRNQRRGDVCATPRVPVTNFSVRRA